MIRRALGRVRAGIVESLRTLSGGLRSVSRELHVLAEAQRLATVVDALVEELAVRAADGDLDEMPAVADAPAWARLVDLAAPMIVAAMRATTGAWTTGRASDAIVVPRDGADPRSVRFHDETTLHYGGHLVAESLLERDRDHVLAAAPERVMALARAAIAAVREGYQRELTLRDAAAGQARIAAELGERVATSERELDELRAAHLALTEQHAAVVRVAADRGSRIEALERERDDAKARADAARSTITNTDDLVEIARIAAGGKNRPSYNMDPTSFAPHQWVIDAMRAVERLWKIRLGAEPDCAHPDGCDSVDPAELRDCRGDGHNACRTCTRHDAEGES